MTSKRDDNETLINILNEWSLSCDNKQFTLLFQRNNTVVSKKQHLFQRNKAKQANKVPCVDRRTKASPTDRPTDRRTRPLKNMRDPFNSFEGHIPLPMMRIHITAPPPLGPFSSVLSNQLCIYVHRIWQYRMRARRRFDITQIISAHFPTKFSTSCLEINPFWIP